MRDIAYGFVAGLAAYWLWLRTARKILIRQFDPRSTKTIGREILGKMGYDSLLKFQEAVEQELSLRRAPGDP